VGSFSDQLIASLSPQGNADVVLAAIAINGTGIVQRRACVTQKAIKVFRVPDEIGMVAGEQQIPNEGKAQKRGKISHRLHRWQEASNKP
jgi:hypothetical protein